jgi:peptide/nickel transport system permease protein
VHEQLVKFLSGALHGDLGTSIRYRKPAVEVFMERLPNTLTLVPLALVSAVVIAIPLGLLAAVYRGTIIDRLSGAIAVLGIATPSFWLGIILIYVFSIQLGWLPPPAWAGPRTTSCRPSPRRVPRGGHDAARPLERARDPRHRVRQARRIKGLSQTVVIWKHCLRNALIPVVTLFGVFFALLVTVRSSRKPCSRGRAWAASPTRR